MAAAHRRMCRYISVFGPIGALTRQRPSGEEFAGQSTVVG